MNDIKERIREANPIAEVVGEKIQLRQASNQFVGLCIFHKDQSKPNLYVYPKTESFYCFACGAGGDVFSFVMRSQNLQFIDAMKFLADKKSIPFSLNGFNSEAEERNREIEDALRGAVVLYHKALPPEVRQYLKSRTLTDETIDRYLIGFCGGNSIFQSKREVLIEAGLLRENGQEYFEGYITFPNFYRGKVVYISGRAHPDKDPLKLKPFKNKLPLEHLFNEDALREKEVIICEGEIDTMTLLQNGFNATGVLGATSFKEEWAQKFLKVERVYLSFDGDKAGDNANQKIARLLGLKSRIVCLPVGEDVNDYFKHAPASEYQKLLDESLNLIETKIKAIPPTTLRTELPSLLNPILEEIAALEDLAYGDALLYSVIKEHFDLKGKAFESYEAVLKKLRKEGKQEQEEAASPPLNQNELIEILKADESCREINPAQDFKNGMMFFTVLIRQTPYLITSEKRLISFEDAAKEGLILRNEDVSISRFSPAGIREFLEGGREVNIPELYERIYDYIRRFVFLADTRVISYLSLWVMGTYLFTIFRYYPYIWLNAEKGSGKTLLMEILAAIAFNGELVTNPTEATLFRDVAGNMTSLFIDEVENLRKQDKETAGAVMAVLNTGFCKSGIVKRNVKNSEGNYVVKPFSTYSPKVFAGINEISDILRDRTVCIRLLKKKENEVAERYKETDAVLKLQRQIRNDLYVFALTCASQIAALSREQEGQIQGLGHLANRELDIWEPIILLANVIDGLTGKDEITSSMESLSKESLIEKQAENIEQNETYKLLSVMKVMIGEMTAESGEDALIFNSDTVLDYFKKTDEFSWLERKNALTARLKRIGVRSEQRREGAGRVRVYIVDLKKFEDLCERFKI